MKDEGAPWIRRDLDLFLRPGGKTQSSPSPCLDQRTGFGKRRKKEKKENPPASAHGHVGEVLRDHIISRKPKVWWGVA